MSNQSVLSDEQLLSKYSAEFDFVYGGSGFEVRAHYAGLRAVAEAAIAADRAARAEPVAYRLSYEFMGKNREILTGSVVVADAIKECRPCVIDPLYTAPPAAPVVPEGWRIERMENGSIALSNPEQGELEVERYGSIYEETLWELANAMLAAAPAPSQEPNK